MAKVVNVKLKSIPDTIHVGDDINDITVIVKLEFHPLDLSLEMEYMLHLFVYDIHGKMDVPVVISNWEDSLVLSVSEDGRKDYFLGRKTVRLKANMDKDTFEIPMALKLGDLTDHYSSVTRKFEVLATLVPAISKASKWSAPFESHLLF